MENTSERSPQFFKNSNEEKKCILVVDDNEDFLDITTMILSMNDFEVSTASGARSALAMLRDGAKPDLIFLDYLMQGMSGSEFLERLEKDLPGIFNHVPVVFLSGMDEIPESKAAGFVKKPIDMKQFLVAAHHYIETGVGHRQSH